ncbi:MAG: ROK family protein [Clostridia bacterium]|nr:ROK family protein [Clostridia bacterium]
MKYRIGVDLGGTNIVAGIVDENNKIIAKAETPTNTPRPAEAIFDDIAKISFEALEKAGATMDDVISVGVGTPGSVNKDNGNIEFANNLGFDNVPAQEMLEARLHKNVYLDNDANCAALGEAVAGCGNGVKDFVAITLGTGVGSGIIVGGKLVVGKNFAAGEMGHHVIVFGGIRCNCGRRGCWEKYASATALIAQTKEAMEADPSTVMWELVGGDISKVSGRTAFDGERRGDALAKEVVEQYIAYVACGVANIVNTFQPEVVCVGGGIANEGENLLARVRKIVEGDRYSKHAKVQTKILKAELGNNAGIIGAALLDE